MLSLPLCRSRPVSKGDALAELTLFCFFALSSRQRSREIRGLGSMVVRLGDMSGSERFAKARNVRRKSSLRLRPSSGQQSNGQSATLPKSPSCSSGRARALRFLPSGSSLRFGRVRPSKTPDAVPPRTGAAWLRLRPSTNLGDPAACPIWGKQRQLQMFGIRWQRCSGSENPCLSEDGQVVAPRVKCGPSSHAT